MCMGIRDAFNLAWKLASVINKDAEHPLLDSYEDERNPHARAYVEMAIKIGQIIRSINHNDALSDVSGHRTRSGEMRSITPKLGPSSLTAPRSNSNTDIEGRPATQFRIQPSDVLMDDVSGYRHVIISNTRPEGIKDSIFWVNASEQEEAAKLLKDLDAEAAWIRPDRYLGAATKSIQKLYEYLPNFLKNRDKCGDFNETSFS